MNDKSGHFCNWCNQPSVVIWVHGHGQCSICGINVDECCRGERENENYTEPRKTGEEDSETEGD